MPAGRRGAAGRAEALGLPVWHVVPGYGEHGSIDVHGVGVDVVAMVVQVRAGDLNSRAVTLKGSGMGGVLERLAEIRLLVGEKVIGREMLREM